jgi:hypothetical protein
MTSHTEKMTNHDRPEKLLINYLSSLGVTSVQSHTTFSLSKVRGNYIVKCAQHFDGGACDE